MQVKRVMQYPMEPLLEPLPGPPFHPWNRLEGPFQRTVPALQPHPAPFCHPSIRPFQR